MLYFKIWINHELDKKAFLNYLFNKDFLSKWSHIRKSILRCYSSLSEQVNNNLTPITWEYIIEKFIDSKYLYNDKKIKVILEKWNILFNENIQQIENWFKQTMDYNMNNEKICLSPSFLPTSTFWDNIVRFSIVSEIFKNQQPPYLDIFLHEYTHIIWERQIYAIYNNIGKLNNIWHDYLKEIVAPVIIRNSIWNKIRQSEQNKYANQRQQLLNITVDWKNYNIVDYFEAIYNNLKKNWKSFSEISIKYIKIFKKIENQIIDKHVIFSKFWYNPNDKDNSLNILKKNGYFNSLVIHR